MQIRLTHFYAGQLKTFPKKKRRIWIKALNNRRTHCFLTHIVDVLYIYVTLPMASVMEGIWNVFRYCFFRLTIFELLLTIKLREWRLSHWSSGKWSRGKQHLFQAKWYLYITVFWVLDSLRYKTANNTHLEIVLLSLSLYRISLA